MLTLGSIIGVNPNGTMTLAPIYDVRVCDPSLSGFGEHPRTKFGHLQIVIELVPDGWVHHS
jgi:hypothetical protein